MKHSGGAVARYEVIFKVQGDEEPRLRTVALTEGYTMEADIPTILAIPLGRKAEEIQVIGKMPV